MLWNNINAIRMDLTDDWAALANFTLESSIMMHGVQTSEVHVPQAGGKDVEHMRLDMLHFHHLGGILASETLSGGGTWQANAAGKEYLGRFPDVTREHLTITPRANGITATLTDNGRWGTHVNGTRMVKGSSIVVSNYSEIRLASKAILLVRVKEVEVNDD